MSNVQLYYYKIYVTIFILYNNFIYSGLIKGEEKLYR